jgi:hypothetical protein
MRNEALLREGCSAILIIFTVGFLTGGGLIWMLDHVALAIR